MLSLFMFFLCYAENFPYYPFTGEQESRFVWLVAEAMYNCYFPPNEAHDNFRQALGKLKDDLKMARREVTVTGDFHWMAYEWDSRKTDTRGIDLLDMLGKLD